MKYLLFFALFSFQYSKAQTNETAQDYVKNCQAIINNAQGKAEDYASLINFGQQGLSKTNTADYSTQCQLNHFIGLGYYNQFNFDSAKKYFEQTHALAIKSKASDKEAYSLGALIQIYHYLNESNKSDSIAKILQAVLDTSTNNITKANGYYALGQHEAQIKSFLKLGLSYFLKSLSAMKVVADTATSPKFKIQFSITSLSIADIYLRLKQPEKALEYLNSAREYASLSLPAKVGLLCRFVKTYAALKNADSCIFYQDLLEKATAGSSGKWSELVTSNISIANYYLEKNEPDAAKKFIDSAYARAKIANTQMLLSQADAVIGKYYLLKNDYPSAKKYFENAVTVIYSVDRDSYCDIRKSLAIIAIREGNSAEAGIQLNLYAQANDSLTAEKTSNNIAEMEAIYQNKEKQQQIETRDIQLSFGQRQRLWLIAGLALAALVAILLVFIYRNKKKTSDLLDEKNKTLSSLNHALEEANETKAKLFSIISHDLRSPISQVYQFLKLQQLNPGRLDENQKQQLNEKIQAATGSLLEAMEDLLLWSKTQMARFNAVFSPTALLPVIERCEQLLQLNIEAKNITVTKDILPTASIDTDEDLLRTIVRNLLQNAVKAAPQNSVIKIVFAENVLTIANEGEPFTQQQYEKFAKNNDPSKGLSGLGLNLVDELSKKINATVRFENPSYKETIAVLTF